MSGSVMMLAPTHPPDFTSATMSVCTHCGHDLPTPDEAHRRIKDLEAQVRLLNTKAAAAVDKSADYEDELQSLRTSYTQLQQQHQPPRQQSQTSPPKTQTSQRGPSVPIPASASATEQLAPSPVITPPIPTQTPTPASPPRNTASRLASLSSFLPGRKRDTTLLSQQGPSTPTTSIFPGQVLSETPPRLDATTNEPSATHSQSLHSLQATLETERSLRLRAESSLTQTQSELEELTATLFGQANEMVAQERKARAKLEERVKMLEDRDGEKRRRLERLEKAMERIERVRGLVRREEEVGGKEKENEAMGEKDHRPGELRVVNDIGVTA